MSKSGSRVKQILVVIATIGVLLVNYLAGTGYINNTQTGDVSDKYPTFITPAGYAFSIWSLIYLGLLAFSIYQALPKNAERFSGTRTLYILNCAANCAWLYLWHYDQITASAGVMLLLLGTLILINLDLLKTGSGAADFWFARVPFNIYFGWITVATILNFTIALVSLGVKTSDLATNITACVLLVVAAALGVVMRFRFENAAYALTVAWALTAIAIKQSGRTAIVTVCAFGVMAQLFAALYGYVQSKSKPQ